MYFDVVYTALLRTFVAIVHHSNHNDSQKRARRHRISGTDPFYNALQNARGAYDAFGP